MNAKFMIIIAVSVLMIAALTASTLYGMRTVKVMKNFQYAQAKMQTSLTEAVNYVNNINLYSAKFSTVADNWEKRVVNLRENVDYIMKSEERSALPEEFLDAMKYLPDVWRTINITLGNLSLSFKELQAIQLDKDGDFYFSSMGIQMGKVFLKETPYINDVTKCWTKLSEMMPTFLESYDIMDEMNHECMIRLDEITAQREKQFTYLSIFLACLSSLSLLIVVRLMTGNITKRIKRVRDISLQLAEKDFTVALKPSGSSEMKNLMANMNNMVNELNDFFLVVKKSAAKAIDSGLQITNSANSTAAATTEIDAHIESITNEFEQITASVGKCVHAIAEMNRQVDNLSHFNSRQTQAIDNSNRTVMEASATLEKISSMAEHRARSAQEMHELVANGDEKISHTAKMLEEVKNQLTEITGVVKIINDIASQTNLLSMNAAIESAHAGDAGQGFAVVAGEIRTLAESTSVNAKKIRESIKGIVDTVASANDASKEASLAFGRVRENADKVINSLQDIAHEIVSIDDHMKNIREKSDETAIAAGEINTFCGRLAEKQKDVSDEVTSMNVLFSEAMGGIREIKRGTSDIVSRITEVSDNSKDSYKNMTDLENILDEFKTKELEITELQEPVEGEVKTESESSVAGTEEAVEFSDIIEEVEEL